MVLQVPLLPFLGEPPTSPAPGLWHLPGKYHKLELYFQAKDASVEVLIENLITLLND